MDFAVPDEMKEVLEGASIEKVRSMTEEEQEGEMWTTGGFSGPPVVLVLSNGLRLYPAQDPEGNGAGCLFGRTEDEGCIRFGPRRQNRPQPQKRNRAR